MAARVIGERYELLHEIGRGGMGTVFAGRDLKSGRSCAVKVLREGTQLGGDAKERFEREARAPDKIGHPGVTEVYDAFVTGDGQMVIVMELLRGMNLRELIQEGYGLRELMAVLLGALDPLAAAHGAGFVHRDMKPDNIFLADEPGGPRVKILDFGIARDLGSGALTQTGVIVGSTHYISPEQAHSARLVEPAADVFSIGVMLYEVTTGMLPFAADTQLRTLTNLAAGKFVPLDKVVTGLKAELVELVHECLAFEPAARPRDAAVLREALAPLVPGALPSPRRSIPATIPAAAAESEVRPVSVRPSFSPPMDHAVGGQRARGTNIVLSVKALKTAVGAGRDIPLTDEEAGWLEQRVLESEWYPLERFWRLAHLVHEHLMGGTENGALRMGEFAAKHNLSGVHASFIKEGDVLRTLKRVPALWSRYYDFGSVEVEPSWSGEVVVSVHDYPNMPAVHELMIIGWFLEIIRLAGGTVVEHQVLTRRGGSPWRIRARYADADESSP